MSKNYFCSSLNTIQKDKWNKCIGDDHPFLQYEFLIALEKSFISDKGMYFGSWYKSIYASSDPFSGYGAWILPGIEYEIALKSSDKLNEWDQRYSNSINSLNQKMKKL